MGKVEQAGWKRLKSHLVLDRLPWLRVYADDVELPDGRHVDGYLRVEGPAFTMIFAVTSDDQALFIKEYKYGTGAIDLQLPAGYIEAGEDPDACARRELLEETGYASDAWTSLGSYYVDGNRGYSRGHFYLATGAHPVQAAAAGDLSDVVVRAVSLADVPGVLSGGEMLQMSPIACASLALIRLGHPQIGTITGKPQ